MCVRDKSQTFYNIKVDVKTAKIDTATDVRQIIDCQ